VGELPRGRKSTKIVRKLEQLVENKGSSGAQNFRPIAGIPSDPLYFEVLS